MFIQRIFLFSSARHELEKVLGIRLRGLLENEQQHGWQQGSLPERSHLNNSSSRNTSMKKSSRNILGETLVPCGLDPVTGFYRDGCCDTGPEDVGSHTVCVAVTDDFLSFTAAVGNDLSTPMPAYGFPGLKDGDRWCLCASRWLQAHEAGHAPRVFVQSTHEAALRIIPLEVLTAMAADLN